LIGETGLLIKLFADFTKELMKYGMRSVIEDKK